MTREEEIEKASIKEFSGITVLPGVKIFIECCRLAFQKGAKWADAYPKLPWINYKEEKPPFGVEVVAYHHKWVDEDFNPNGTRVGFLSDDGFISAFWWDYQDCYETISKSHCESNKDFYRSHLDNTEPEFWFPIPKFLKPSKNGN